MPSSHVRSLLSLAIAGVALSSSGCLFASHRQADEGAEWLRTVTFESPTNVAIVPSMYGAVAEPGALPDVTELGGRIDEISGDSLVVALIYVVVPDLDHPGRSRYETKSSPDHALPDRVLVILQPGTRVGAFRARGADPPWLTTALRVGPLIYLVAHGLYALHHH